MISVAEANHQVTGEEVVLNAIGNNNKTQSYKNISRSRRMLIFLYVLGWHGPCIHHAQNRRYDFELRRKNPSYSIIP